MAKQSRPNIHDTLDRAPGLLDAYRTIAQTLSEGTLTAVERNVVLIAASVENGCTYCVPVYTLALKSAGLSERSIEFLRSGDSLDEERLDVLAAVTRALIRNKGRLDDSLRVLFRNAGFVEDQLLEVVLAIAQKTITNYANALFEPELDAQFQAGRWEPPAKR